ncbi:hypothetical protein [Lactiplantibacillus modestisalitolerans]|uniref:Uncharacterized protein n=1 Tax=Lactiplantibacillus modestisalitolerans TaxID=1457219 RepID=A0ABV5WVA9_9LACO|nr:hypothetical protein [Lactiplantibacillus modestisalitolerans]
MRRRRGSLLISVVSFLLIAGAFETTRYQRFQERQELYQLILKSYDNPYPAYQPPAPKKPSRPHRPANQSQPAANGLEAGTMPPSGAQQTTPPPPTTASQQAESS